MSLLLFLFRSTTSRRTKSWVNHHARFLSTTSIKPTTTTTTTAQKQEVVVVESQTTISSSSNNTSTTTNSTTSFANAKSFWSIPGSWKGSLPLIGVAPLFLPYVDQVTGGMRTEDFMKDQYEQYGKQYGLAKFGQSIFGTKDNVGAVLVFDEGFLQILKHDGKYPVGILEGAWPITDYNRLNGIVTQNPFLQRGEAWRKGRMDINPYIFNISTTHSYLPAICEAANIAAESFVEYATMGRLDQFCERAAFDMFNAASLGLQLNSVGGNPQGDYFANQIIGSINTMSQVSAQCPYSKVDLFKFQAWKDFDSDWQRGRIATDELRRLAFEQKQGSGHGIMHGFLNDPNLSITKDEAIEMLMILTFAASDTTSSQIHNMLNNLSKHKHVQDQVRKEMQHVLQGGDYHAQAKLPYFEQVLKETQRLTPPLPWVVVKNKIDKDFVINGFHIPKGKTVIFSHMGIKYDETLAGPNPHVFDPDRYSSKHILARRGTRAEFLDHPICTKPFGFGPRMCVGSRIAKLEYTALLCRLLQNFEIQHNTEKSPSPSIRLSRTTTMEHPCPVYNVTKLV